MKLPQTSASPVLWLDPSEKFITRDKNNLVSSVIDRISGRPITQPDSTKQPIWSATGMAKNSPGLVFSGNQWLNGNFIAPYFNAGNTPIIIIQTFKLASNALDIQRAFYFSALYRFQGTAAFFGQSMQNFSGQTVRPALIWACNDDLNNFNSNANSITLFNDFNTHVLTTIYDPTIIINSGHQYTSATLKLDGKILSKTLILTESGAGTFSGRDSFTIGSVINSGFPSTLLAVYGTIGHTLIYLGFSGILEIEQALLEDLNQ